MAMTSKTFVLGGLMALLATSAGGPLHAQTWRTMTSARQVWGTEPIDVEIEYGAGTLEIGPAETPMLYQMKVRYDADSFEPVAEFDESDRRLRLGIDGIGDHHNLDLHNDAASATIALTREVPIDLDLEFGAGKANIELGGIALRKLSLSTGASETRVGFDVPNPIAADSVTIEAGAADLRVIGLGNTRARRIHFEGGVGATVLDFSGAWESDVSAQVEMGIGSVTLRLPRDQGIRVNRSSFLTTFHASGLDRQGDSYYSANWAEAPYQLTIDVDAAFGSIEIEWVE